jgi:hypothetical protein
MTAHVPRYDQSKVQNATIAEPNGSHREHFSALQRFTDHGILARLRPIS